MPSFAFWKSAKADEAKAPLLSDAAVKEELSVIIPGVARGVDLDPGNQDSGVFMFDEDAQEIPGDQTPVIGPVATGPAQLGLGQPAGHAESGSGSVNKVDTSLLDVREPSLHPQSPALVPEDPLVQEASEEIGSQLGEAEEVVAIEPPQPEILSSSALESSHDTTIAPNSPSHPVDTEVVAQVDLPQPETPSSAEPSSTLESGHEATTTPNTPIHPVSLAPKESGPTLAVRKRAPAALGKIETSTRDADSGVYLSDHESSPARSRPSSIASNDNTPLRSRVISLSKPSTPSPQRTNSIARLQRPAELNLGFSSAPDPAKPKSELDMRFDLIRNSKTQSKAALRSPTQLLQDRLNMSPKKKDAAEKVRVFTPPRALINGCLLPGPGAQAEAFTSTSVRARTEAGARPAWWCKFDKLVVFDGVEQVDGDLKLQTRTSKGLTIARRRGDLETVVIPLDCAHCHEMLNRHEWKYDMRVCKRSVCWDCQERCKWELEQEKMMAVATPRTDANRERADSMLQDEQGRSCELRKEIAV